MRKALSIALTISVLLVGCKGTTAPADPLGGVWTGTLAATATHPSVTVQFTLISTGHGDYDGASDVKASSGEEQIYQTTIGILFNADSVSITAAQGNAFLSFDGSVSAGVLTGSLGDGFWSFKHERMTLRKP